MIAHNYKLFCAVSKKVVICREKSVELTTQDQRNLVVRWY
jgi:hypothetical protein